MTPTEKQLRKGCGKKFIWINYLNDERICGKFEDLKHSEHIILCSICEAKLQQYLADKKEFLEMIDSWLSIFIMDNDCEFCKAHKSKLEELKQQLSDEEEIRE